MRILYKIWISLLGIVLIATLYAVLVVAPLATITTINCAAWGYDSEQIFINLDRYCVREVNETQYVIPYDSAQGFATTLDSIATHDQ